MENGFRQKIYNTKVKNINFNNIDLIDDITEDDILIDYKILYDDYINGDVIIHENKKNKFLHKIKKYTNEYYK